MVKNTILGDLFVCHFVRGTLKLFLIHSFDQEASEFIPLHVTVSVDVNFVEQEAEPVDEVTLLIRVLVWDHLLH